MQNYWREKAQTAIAEVLGEFFMTHDPNNLDETEKRELRTRIDVALPLDFRSPRSREVWRDEKGKAFDRYGLRSPTALKNQLALFEDYSC